MSEKLTFRKLRADEIEKFLDFFVADERALHAHGLGGADRIKQHIAAA